MISIPYKDQLIVMNSYGVKLGESIRRDCCFCKGQNTLSISNLAGVLLWHCFRASCTISGASKPAIQKHQIEGLIMAVERPKERYSWAIPEYFIPYPSFNKTVLNIVERHACNTAYDYGLVRLYLDPKLDRLVFIKKDQNGIPIIAIGKAVTSIIKPKWYNYTLNDDSPFILNLGSDVGVILEDILSACVVAVGGLGAICLTGTIWKEGYTVAVLKEFKHLLICLDKDATNKALELQKKLNYIIPTSVRILSQDLKWYRPEEIGQLLKLKELDCVYNSPKLI